jgi:phage baseplate assembly protein W
MFLRKHFLGRKTQTVTEIEDIVENLGNVLRTKRGSGYFLESFGLSDVGYRTPEEMITNLTAEIRENVRLYEPRVELVDVDDEYDDDGNRARLVIQLKLRSKDERLGLVIDLKGKKFDIRHIPPPGREGET